MSERKQDDNRCRPDVERMGKTHRFISGKCAGAIIRVCTLCGRMEQQKDKADALKDGG